MKVKTRYQDINLGTRKISSRGSSSVIYIPQSVISEYELERGSLVLPTLNIRKREIPLRLVRVQKPKTSKSFYFTIPAIAMRKYNLKNGIKANVILTKRLIDFFDDSNEKIIVVMDYDTYRKVKLDFGQQIRKL